MWRPRPRIPAQDHARVGKKNLTPGRSTVDNPGAERRSDQHYRGMLAGPWTIVTVLSAIAGAAAPCWVLDGLDAERSEAYARSDRAALAELYAPGAVALAADLALFDRYRERGLRIRDLRVERRSCTVVEPGRVLVTERLRRPVAVLPDGDERTLPGGGWSERLIRLEFTGGRWRLADAIESAAYEEIETG